MKKLFFIVLICYTGINVCRAQESANQELLDKKYFAEAVSGDKKVQLIDVRTPEEYEAGTIKYAENIDYFSDDFIEKINALDKEEPVYIFCKSGKRSTAAKEKILKNGFERVYELKGGYLNWTEETKD